MRGLQHPALAPGIDDPVSPGRLGNDSKGHLENDRVDILARLRVPPAVHEAIVAVAVFEVTISTPSQRTLWKIELYSLTMFRVFRIEIEELVAFQLDKRL